MSTVHFPSIRVVVDTNDGSAMQVARGLFVDGVEWAIPEDARITLDTGAVIPTTLTLTLLPGSVEFVAEDAS